MCCKYKYMQIQNICKYKIEAQTGSRVSQSSEIGFQGRSQTENIVLQTQSQSKQNYYYEKRCWDQYVKQRPHTLNSYLRSFRERKKIACILHKSPSSPFFLNYAIGRRKKTPLYISYPNSTKKIRNKNPLTGRDVSITVMNPSPEFSGKDLKIKVLASNLNNQTVHLQMETLLVNISTTKMHHLYCMRVCV